MSAELIGYDDAMGASYVGYGAEMIGADYVGDDDLGHLMAMGAAPVRRHAAPGRHMELKSSSRGVWREQYLPINLTTGPTGTIAGGAVVTVSTVLQKVFRCNRFILDSGVAGGYVINDIRVGVAPQLAAVGSLPGRMFVETAVNIKLHGDTGMPGQSLTVVAQNITGGALSFVAAFQGMVVE